MGQRKKKDRKRVKSGRERVREKHRRKDRVEERQIGRAMSGRKRRRQGWEREREK